MSVGWLMWLLIPSPPRRCVTLGLARSGNFVVAGRGRAKTSLRVGESFTLRYPPELSRGSSIGSLAGFRWLDHWPRGRGPVGLRTLAVTQPVSVRASGKVRVPGESVAEDGCGRCLPETPDDPGKLVGGKVTRVESATQFGAHLAFEGNTLSETPEIRIDARTICLASENMSEAMRRRLARGMLISIA